MENNYNINFNPQTPSNEAIEKHKDFDALLQQFAATPEAENPMPEIAPKTAIIKRMYWGLGAVAAILCGFLLYKNVADATRLKNWEAQPFVNTPLKGIEKAFTTYEIDATKGGEITYPTGSKIKFPARTFVDERGIAIEGKVKIQYREFHDYVDFFLSGIPMRYDSAGVAYNLESAGMLEIRAEQTGKTLSVAKDKAIAVDLVSTLNLPKPKGDTSLSVPNFNVYYLDTQNRNWAYQMTDKIDIQPITENKGEAMKLEDRLNNIAAKEADEVRNVIAEMPILEAPAKPKRANSTDFVFNFDFEGIKRKMKGEVSNATKEVVKTETEIDDLRKQYVGTLWQLDHSQAALQTDASKTKWDDMNLVALNNNDYELSLIRADKTMKLLVHPVLTGKNYETAQTAFAQQMQEYEQKMREQQAILAQKKVEIKAKNDREREIAKLDDDARIKAYQENGSFAKANDEIIKTKIVNHFQVTQLGMWNCDRPLPPDLLQVTAQFKGMNNEDLSNSTAYLVNSSRNTVARFYAADGTSVDFDKTAKNMLWTLTQNNRIAIFRPEQFKNIGNINRNDTYTFHLEVIDKELKTEADIRGVLGM
ncbi:MAG: hypothetical protein RLZZ292_2783 [Bacteroidota bacterium]|jgi:hypothetical protein